jgi:hypothetical protein
LGARRVGARAFRTGNDNGFAYFSLFEALIRDVPCHLLTPPSPLLEWR